jgi:hypothetical protein
MSKRRRKEPGMSRPRSGTEGSASRPLAPTSRGGPKDIASLGMATLNAIAAELGLPVGIVRKVLEADPSLIEAFGGIKSESSGTDGGGLPSAMSGTSVGAGPGEATPTDSSPKIAEGLLIDLQSPLARLFVPETRPRCCQIDGSQAVKTPGMFTVEMAQYDIRIYNSNGDQITRIWGDPHVNENGGGDDWHFGNNSSFVLTDGTKICLDTKETSPGVWLVQGIDIIGGNDRYHFGTGGESGLTKDGNEWDKSHTDSANDVSAGIFAMKSDGTWAKQGKDGHFYDVQDESWGDYLKSGDVTSDTSKQVEISELQQHSVLYDHLPDYMEEPRGGQWDKGPDTGSQFETMKLQIPKNRPQCVQYPDSNLVQTPLGYTVEMKGTEILIWDLQGKRITRIWGDPHVNEKEGGDNWHFGGNSTFILPDGTKVQADTEPMWGGLWVVVGVDVVLGESRFHSGSGDQEGMHSDGKDWDKKHSDSDNREDAGIFALTPSGEWAMMGRDGHFYDINEETWGAYLKDPDVDLDSRKRVDVTTQQQFAARSDQLPIEMMMPAVGEVHEAELPAEAGAMRELLKELRNLISVERFNLIRDQEPDILPALAVDEQLAQYVAQMPVATLRLLLDHAPGLIVQAPSEKAPADAIWPRPEMAGLPTPEPWWT